MDVFSYALGKKAGGGGTPATLIDKNISANGTYNASQDEADGYKKVVVDVEPNLQNKSETITSNTTTTISADQGYDGLGTVSVTTNVPVPVQRDWTEIGYDVEPEFIERGFQYAKEILQNWDVSTTDTHFLFREDRNLVFVPDLDMRNVTTMRATIFNTPSVLYAKLTHINNAKDLYQLISDCKAIKKIILGNATDVTNCGYIVANNSALEEVDLSGIQITKTANLESAFKDTIAMCKLDISNMDFSDYTGSFNTNTFANCGKAARASKGAYADGIPYVYVKDATAQNWVLTASNGHPSNWSTNNVVIKGA